MRVCQYARSHWASTARLFRRELSSENAPKAVQAYHIHAHGVLMLQRVRFDLSDEFTRWTMNTNANNKIDMWCNWIIVIIKWRIFLFSWQSPSTQTRPNDFEKCFFFSLNSYGGNELYRDREKKTKNVYKIRLKQKRNMENKWKSIDNN